MLAKVNDILRIYKTVLSFGWQFFEKLRELFKTQILANNLEILVIL